VVAVLRLQVDVVPVPGLRRVPLRARLPVVQAAAAAAARRYRGRA
jgi:hypothetical protein